MNEITGEIVDVAFRLHSRLGPGLLESVFETVLARLLQERGLHVERQKAISYHIISFEFDGYVFDDGLRVDLFVENTVVVELKAVDKVAPVHMKQVLTYLRLLNLPVGLLINFGAERMKDGLQRITNFAAPRRVIIPETITELPLTEVTEYTEELRLPPP